jgi:hypothetical protein
MVVPFIVRTFRKRRIVRAIPVWFWTSVLGAALIVIGDYSIGITYGIKSAKYVVEEWFALSVFTLPVTALVYYSKLLIGWIKRWHEGRRVHPSILQR